MKTRMVLCMLVVLAIASYAGASPKQSGPSQTPKVAASGDTIYIPGGTLAGGENAGLLETTINGDTTTGGQRVNPNRVYALNQGQVYYQYAPIICNNPTGMLTIAGIPSSFGTTKPVIIIAPQAPVTVVSTNNGATVNLVYGSVKCDGIHYQAMQTSGTTTNELFQCGTANEAPQQLIINNCLFEFSNIDLFDCTNESGAIGGWPNGAKFFITNSYFRNMFYAGQWWGSRVFQCKHPIDTCWIENSTFTTGGLTFLQQNNLCDFLYVNHNTILNNKKYWMLSPYRHSMYITNNIFVNQNWVGEDTNVTNSGQDPDKLFMSTINIDTNNTTNGETVQPKYMIDSAHFVPALAFDKMQIYVSNNFNYYDPSLVSGYYNSSKYLDATINALPSYLTWFGYPGAPFKIGNIPGAWMNTRTAALFAQYAPPNGGFVEEHTFTDDPALPTPTIANAGVVDSMAVWNQNQWGDPRFPATSALTSTAYIYGDYDPATIPGTKTEDGSGITKFSDLTENFACTRTSTIDGFPIGALMWDDQQNANYLSSQGQEWQKVYDAYLAAGGLSAVQHVPGTPLVYALSQNYPNPFNPSTRIQFSLPKASNVTLKVFNMLGQEVATLVSGSLSAGDHDVTFNAKNLASGLYFYRLTADQFTSVKKMMLLK